MRPKKYPVKPEQTKKGVHYGKKRFRIPDPYAPVLSVVVAVLTGALAVLSNAKGFDKVWYGDILTTVDCVIGFFALLNIGYIFMEGICVENGVAFLGTDSEKKPIGFAFSELADIALYNEEGEELPADASHWVRAEIRFTLKNGATRSYTAHYLTQKKYRMICSYFEKT